jgi:hypothetical protein
MTFLNPLVLFGLAAAAIPVILHLLNLRKLKTIEFSTLAFLKELQQTKIRRLKLRQILLLLLRTLLVALIVLAFARPALRGTFLNEFGTKAHSTILIILDDSFSMQATDEHGERFKQAKEAAERLTRLWSDGDELMLLKLSDPATPPSTHDVELIRTAIREAQVSPVRRPMIDALRTARVLLQRSTNVNKELYIVSDMQSTLVQAAPQEPGLDAKVFMVRIGSTDVPNVCVDSVRVTTAILEKEKPVVVYASMRNFGPLPLRNFVVNIYLDGTKAAQSSLSLEPYGSASLEMAVIPKRTGSLSGYIETESDGIEIDNRRYFTLHIPDRISVVVAGTDDADNRFLSLALRAGSGDQGGSLLAVEQVSGDKLPQVDLKHVDVLVCTNIRSFSPGDADRVKHFVEEGGGLVLFPGSDLSYNLFLLPTLRIPPIGGVTTTAGEISFRKVDLDHPLFARMFEQERKHAPPPPIESPAIHKLIHREAGKRARTVITLSDGSPFLTEHTLGSGKILFYSVSPTLTWSDLPLKGIFAPLLYRSMMYVSPKEHQQLSYLVGAQPTIEVPNTGGSTEPGRRFAMKGPDGVEEILQPSIRSVGGGGGFATTLSFAVQPLRAPGIYTLSAGPTPIVQIAANIDAKESDLRTATTGTLAPFWKQAGIDPARVVELKPSEQLQSTVMESRLGVELWKYCLFLALITALAEMLIARDSRNVATKD